MKFALGGDRGLDILVSAVSRPIGCATLQPAGPFVAAESVPGLALDPSTDIYQYNWKTEGSWTNCREFQIALRDGSTQSAYFQLR